MIAAGTVQHYL